MIRYISVAFFLCVLLTGCNAENASSTINGPKAFVNGYTIDLEIASSTDQKTMGLSNREALQENQGMLFVFPDSAERTFWMKDMKFPIDIIWIKDNQIKNITTNLKPEGTQPKNVYHSNGEVNYVLEVSAGWSDSHKIKVGDKINFQL